MIVEVVERVPAGWDEYARSHPGASIYHRSDWLELIREVFGHRVFYVCSIHSGGGINGLLPLVEQRSVLFGHFLTSVPFFNYGGPLANDSATLQALVDAAAVHGKALGAGHIELRTSLPALESWQQRTDKVAMIRNLPANAEALGKDLGSKLRSQIRRLDRENPEIRKGGLDLLEDFYAVFASNMRDLGTPVYGRNFFGALLRKFKDSAELISVRLSRVPVAACLLIHSEHGTEIPWASCLASAKPLGANMRLYWEALTSAISRGSPRFDFGRSTEDAGTYKFKLQWGASPVPLYWYYWTPAGQAIPQLHHGNPKLAAAIAIWQRLPIWLCNLIGPRIVKNLP